MSHNLKPNEIENLRGYIKIIEAFIQGKQLEYRPFDDTRWYPATAPTFNFENGEYRIKPEVKELYYCVYKTYNGFVHTSNPVDKEKHQSNVNFIIRENGVILEERKITVTSEYE